MPSTIDVADLQRELHQLVAIDQSHNIIGHRRQSISDSWLGNLRECLAHLV